MKESLFNSFPLSTIFLPSRLLKYSILFLTLNLFTAFSNVSSVIKFFNCNDSIYGAKIYELLSASTGMSKKP